MWWDTDAILDMDFANSRFRWNGQSYNDETTFLAAIGGSKSGVQRVFGPLEIGSELLSNGNFSGGTTGWTVGQQAAGSGTATQTVVSGENQLTANGADVPFIGQAVNAVLSHAYRVKGKVRKGTGATAPQVVVAPNANGSGSGIVSATGNTTTSFVEYARCFSSVGAGGNLYVGMRVIQNGATGTYLMDDYSAHEVIPFDGFTPGEIAGVIDATTPAAASGTKVVWQVDEDGQNSSGVLERSYARLHWASDGHLHLFVTYQASAGSTTTQADLDLGVVAPSTAFRVAFSIAANAVSASLNGQPAVTDTSASIPGVAIMRLGRSQQASSNNWDGTIERVRLY